MLARAKAQGWLVQRAVEAFRASTGLDLRANALPAEPSSEPGQVACCAALLKAIGTVGPVPIPAAELFEAQRWLLQAVGQ